MDTRRIKNWYQRSFSRAYVTKGLAKMVEVAMKFEQTEIAHLATSEKWLYIKNDLKEVCVLFYIYFIISGEGIDLESVPRETFDDDDLYGDVILSQNSNSSSSQEIILQLEKDKITFLSVTREKDLS